MSFRLSFAKILLLCFFSSNALAQIDEVFIEQDQAQDLLTCSYQIKVVEKGVRKPLEQINVFLLPEGKKEITNDNGVVTFGELTCNQSYQWVINVAGYQRKDIRKLISENTEDTIFLSRINEAFFQTQVVDDREKRDGSKRTLSQDDFIKAVGARGDPIIALENEPGFGGFAAAGEVVIQGAEPEDTRFYVNGHEIPLIFHSLGFSSIFIPETIGSIDFLTAGFGSEYGRTVGGNINLNTIDPKADRLHGLAFVDLLNAGGLIQGPLDEDKNHTFFLGGRISYLGPVFNLVTSEDDNVSFNQVPQFYDLQANYQWKINDQTTFDILGFGAKDQVRLRVKDFEDPFIRGDLAFQTSFYRFIPRLRHRYGEKNRFEISTAHGVDYLDQVIGNFFFDAKIYKPTLRSEWEHFWAPRLSTIVGIDSTYTFFNADLSVPAGSFPNSESQSVPLGLQDIITKEVDEQFLDLGFYSRVNFWDESEKWLISPNARFDYAGLTNQFNVSPRMEIFRTLNDSWKLRAASGIYYQSPQAPEVEVSFGNPNLRDLKSVHYALSAYYDGRKQSSDGFYADTTVFLRQIENVVVSSSDVVEQNGESVPLRFTNEGQSYNVGSQWALRFNSGRVSGALSYTLLWSQRKEPGMGFLPTPADERHNLNLRTRYRIGKWEVSGRARLISGRPQTPILGAFYDLDNDIFFPVEGELNSENLPWFFQLDLRVDRRWVYNTWVMSLYIDVQNITNRQNGFAYDYAFDYSSRTVQGGIPILPTFGIKGEF